MILKNARIYTPEHVFVRGGLAVREGRILPEVPAPEPGEEVVDAGGAYALPGLVDIHFHGAAGCDLCDGTEAALRTIADFEARHGVTAICPAVMTYPEAVLSRVMDAAAAYRNDRGAELIGIHLEGPFLSPRRVGAQNPAYVRGADMKLLRRLQARSVGKIRIVDVAPEEPGNLDFIRACRAEYGDAVRISLAHTCTDYDTARAAFAAGAGHLTHTYNAMPGISHRAPGPIPAAAECGAEAELIADGVHIHPAVVRMTFALFGAARVILISDSMRACGLPDGEYDLGGQSVTVRGARAVLTRQPDVIAGSVTNLYDCMRCAVREMGVPLEDAVRAASENPARSVGAAEDHGSLAPGRYGNILLADDDLHLRAVYCRGKRIL